MRFQAFLEVSAEKSDSVVARQVEQGDRNCSDRIRLSAKLSVAWHRWTV